MSAKRYGILVEKGTRDSSPVLTTELVREMFKGRKDVLIAGAPSWSQPDDQATLKQLCRKKNLSGLLICGPSPESSQIPDWLPGSDGVMGIRINYAATNDHLSNGGREESTAQAQRLVEVALERLVHAPPLYLASMEVKRKVAVIGSGFAGYQTALAVAQAGLPVAMITSDGLPSCHYPLDPKLVETVTQHPAVEIYKQAKVDYLRGAVGAYKLELLQDGQRVRLDVGALVVAMDAQPQPMQLPEELTQSGRVTSLRDLGAQLAEQKPASDCLCIWLDANGPDRRCVAQAAVRFSHQHVQGGGKAFVLAHHMPVYGTAGEKEYDQARAAGVRFLRLGKAGPDIALQGDQITLRVSDTVLDNRELEFSVDRLVVPESMEPAQSWTDLAQILRVPLDRQGYLQGGNVHHRPVASAQRGIFFAGGCHDECDPNQASLEAGAVVSQIMEQLPAEVVQVPLGRISYDTGSCARCLNCVRACPHHAIQPNDAGHWMEFMDQACYQCGICAAVCPGLAIENSALSFEQMHSALKVATRDVNGQPPVIVFGCRQGAIHAADRAGQMGLPLPPGLLLVDVPCAGQVSDRILLDTVEQGARGIIVLGCHHDNCRSLVGSDLARKRVELLEPQLAGLGVAGSRIHFNSIAANEPFRLIHLLKEALENIPKTGPFESESHTPAQEVSHA